MTQTSDYIRFDRVFGLFHEQILSQTQACVKSELFFDLFPDQETTQMAANFPIRANFRDISKPGNDLDASLARPYQIRSRFRNISRQGDGSDDSPFPI